MKGKLHHKLGIFGACPILLLQDRRITPNALRVYLAIQSFEGTDEVAWPSREKIAARAGISAQAVSAATTRLVETGWLTRKRTFAGSNTYSCCSYSEPVTEFEFRFDPEHGLVVDQRLSREQPATSHSRPKRSADSRPIKSADSRPIKSAPTLPSDKLNEKRRGARGRRPAGAAVRAAAPPRAGEVGQEAQRDPDGERKCKELRQHLAKLDRAKRMVP